MGFDFWVIREKASGRFVGEVGFADWKREIEPALEGILELGYALSPWCHGRRYATEAVRAAVSWGDSHLPAKRTWCLINPEAKASIRVAEKAGYRELHPAIFREQAVLLFDRSTPAPPR